MLSLVVRDRRVLRCIDRMCGEKICERVVSSSEMYRCGQDVQDAQYPPNLVKLLVTGYVFQRLLRNSESVVDE